jgi:hypothetical protein
MKKFPENGWTTKHCNSVKPSAIQASNMAASKPETLIVSQLTHNNYCIFACMARTIENPTAIPISLSIRFPSELLSMLFDIPESLKSMMTAAKSEVFVSRLPAEIE